MSALWTTEATAEQTSTTCEIKEQAGYVYNVDIAIGTYQLVNDIRAHSGKACFLIWLYKLLYMRSMLTQQSSTSGTDAIQFWLDYGFSYKRLSQLVLDLLPLKPMLNDYSCRVVI